MPVGKFTLQGGEALARVLDGLKPATSRRKQFKILREAAKPMRAGMEANAPRGSGSHGRHLADSIVIASVRDRQGDGDATVAVGPSRDAFWGFFQERGTIFHAPQPFAGPAFDSRLRRSFAIIQTRTWQLIRKAIPPVSGGRA